MTLSFHRASRTRCGAEMNGSVVGGSQSQLWHWDVPSGVPLPQHDAHGVRSVASSPVRRALRSHSAMLTASTTMSGSRQQYQLAASELPHTPNAPQKLPPVSWHQTDASGVGRQYISTQNRWSFLRSKGGVIRGGETCYFSTSGAFSGYICAGSACLEALTHLAVRFPPSLAHTRGYGGVTSKMTLMVI